MAISATFAVFDMDHHPRAVDGPDLQARNLADPQACRIGRRQRHAVAPARNRLQKPRDLLGRQHRRKLRGLPTAHDVRHGIRLPEGDAIEEAKRTGDLVDVRARVLLTDQVELVDAHLLRTEPRRRRAEMTAELRHGVDV